MLQFNKKANSKKLLHVKRLLTYTQLQLSWRIRPRPEGVDAAGDGQGRGRVRPREALSNRADVERGEAERICQRAGVCVALRARLSAHDDAVGPASQAAPSHSRFEHDLGGGQQQGLNRQQNLYEQSGRIKMILSVLVLIDLAFWPESGQGPGLPLNEFTRARGLSFVINCF